jgi:hypothetical protein
LAFYLLDTTGLTHFYFSGEHSLMAKFLNATKAISEIEDLIKNAGEKLTLISPFLKISKDFKELLKYRNDQDKATTIVFGKEELKQEELRFLQSLRLVVLRFNENLHAKCYLNEEKMIITSLNLYESSKGNNKEMGVLLEKNEASDAKVFEDALREVGFIISTGQLFGLTPSVNINSSSGPQKNNSISTSGFGYCIRTGAKIPFNLAKPMSYDAFLVWSQFEDPDYPENFCHFSGETSHKETNFYKPVLSKNWKKAKEMYGL